MIREFPIKKIDLLKNSIEYIEDEVVIEKKLELYINENYVTTFFALPEQIKELATGYLLINGLIEKFDDIKNIEIIDQIINVNVLAKKLNTNFIKTSGISSRKLDSIDAYKDYPSMESDYAVRANSIFNMFDELNKRSEIFHLTGGTHSAAVFYNNELISFSEDVSRHNAIYKTIAIAAINKADFSSSILISSGRQSADMVIKAIKVGIPIIASISAPVSSGIELAKRGKVTLICFVRERRMNIYTYPDRIIL